MAAFVRFVQRNPTFAEAVMAMGLFGSIDPQKVLDSIYNGVAIIDEKGYIVYFNGTAERIFNIPSSEALGKYILDVLPNTGGKLLDCLRTATPYYGEKLKGKTVSLVANITPVVQEGRVKGVVSVFQDISEIEEISKELEIYKTMKNWLDTVIDSSYDGLFICDATGRIVRINKASERLSGVKAEEVIGRNVKELVSEGLYDKSVTFEVLKRKAAVTLIQEVRGGRKVLVTGNPVFNDQGQITFVVANSRDISEMDRLRSQLQETQALAREYISRISELELSGVDLSNIIFRSRAMHRVIETSLKMAKFDSTVLITGESGVGKGMIAKLIHKHSDRSQGPFLRIDCAGMPESLIESELFGYERGAFTGAKTDGKPGLIELAHLGTLFLDEIGEIPPASQSKLLRFLEDHQIIRLGGTEPKEIDVRIIAATNKNLEEMVAKSLFRKDLYYRLNVLPIRIPPLRERPEDILPLALHFLGNLNNLFHKTKCLSPEAIECLERHTFPGNVRELSNLIERAFVTSDKDQIEQKDLPDLVQDQEIRPCPDALFSDSLSLKENLERFEMILLERAIKKYGSQRQVARALKVNQSTVSRKRKRSGGKLFDVIVHN